MANEHVRAWYIGRFKQLVKVVYDIRSASWRGCSITGPDVGPVIGARHVLASKDLLKGEHVVSRRGFSRFEDDGRGAGSIALHVEAASVGKLKGALRRILLLLGGCVFPFTKAATDQNECKKC